MRASRPDQPPGLDVGGRVAQRPSPPGHQRLRPARARSSGSIVGQRLGDDLVGDPAPAQLVRHGAAGEPALALRRAPVRLCANAASSISPTSAKRSSTRVRRVVGHAPRAQRVGQFRRLRARRSSSRRQMIRATASGSAGGRCLGSGVGFGAGRRTVRSADASRSPCCDALRSRPGPAAARPARSPSTRAPMPSFSLIRFSISSARSGLSRRKLRTFSLPWPSWSPS